MALAFFGLGVFASASVIWRRPWTAEFSRADYSGAAASPIFTSINMIISGIWAALFLLLALAGAVKAGFAVTAAIVVVGAVTSIFTPVLLVRRALSKRIADRESYRWAAPAFGGARGEANSTSRGSAPASAADRRRTARRRRAEGFRRRAARPAGVFSRRFSANCITMANRWLYRFDAGLHDFSGRRGRPPDHRGPASGLVSRSGSNGGASTTPIATGHGGRCAARLARLCRRTRASVSGGGQRISRRCLPPSAPFTTACIRRWSERRHPGARHDGRDVAAFPRAHPLAVQWLDKPFDQLVAQHIADRGARSWSPR